jgi:sugar lactone lactonase YvrE
MNYKAIVSRLKHSQQCARTVRYSLLMLVLATGFISSSAHGQLLVANGFPNSSNQVLTVNPATPQVTGTFGSATNFDPTPGPMAQDSQGRVYILESNQSRIRRYDKLGNFLGYFASGLFGGGLSVQQGLAIDSADNIYISSGGANSFSISDDSIVRFSSSGVLLGTFGQASNAASGFIAGGPLAFDHQGNLYTGYAGQIVRFSPAGTALGVFATTPSILGLSFNAQGDLFVSGSDILRFGPTGTPLGTFASNSGSIGLAFDGTGNLFATNPTDNTLRKYAPNGTLLAAVPLQGPTNLLMLVPEPCSLLLVGSAACIAVALRRTRRSACKI